MPQPHGTDPLDDWSQTLGREASPLVGILVAVLLVGLVLTLVGGRDLLEAWTEDCLVGTEYQRCTEGQGRVLLGTGLGVALPSATALLVTAARRRRRRRRNPS